jgi:aminomethyltransferase
MLDTLAQTVLHEWHATHGGRLVDFAGWSMPVQYGSIIAEHQATRRAAGLFDVSHMGRLEFIGTGAEAFLDRLLTRKVAGMKPGLVRYSLVTNEQGGILDDVLGYHVPQSETRPSYFQLVVNASNREKIVAWIEQHADLATDFQIADRTLDTAMISLQGPKAIEILRAATGHDPSDMKYYTCLPARLLGIDGLLSRTGYTGEDGLEWIAPAASAVECWNKLLSIGMPLGALPVGLAARDTLRLEAAMPLYGHELLASINPFEAGLGFAVNLEGRTFPGSAALANIKLAPLSKCRVGIELIGKRPAREGATILFAGQAIGHVTSGTHSPTLDRPIAMGYVSPSAATPGALVQIDIRGKQEDAKIVPLPFYQRAK